MFFNKYDNTLWYCQMLQLQKAKDQPYISFLPKAEQVT